MHLAIFIFSLDNYTITISASVLSGIRWGWFDWEFVWTGFGKSNERWSSSLGLVIMGGVYSPRPEGAGWGEAAGKPECQREAKWCGEGCRTGAMAFTGGMHPIHGDLEAGGNCGHKCPDFLLLLSGLLPSLPFTKSKEKSEDRDPL